MSVPLNAVFIGFKGEGNAKVRDMDSLYSYMSLSDGHVSLLQSLLLCVSNPASNLYLFGGAVPSTWLLLGVRWFEERRGRVVG
jgi:hypothetical protein